MSHHSHKKECGCARPEGALSKEGENLQVQVTMYETELCKYSVQRTRDARIVEQNREQAEAAVAA